MTRLLVHVEGQTEEAFVNEVLSDYLLSHGYTQVSARLMGNARLRERRGGIKAWAAVRDDIVRHLKNDSRCIATTMVDYYALPATGDKAWPGRAAASGLPYPQKADAVENQMAQEVLALLAKNSPTARFVPFVVMHEFEALLFSDCAAFSSAIYRADLKDALQAIRAQFGSPEEINDSAQTAPSKRIENLIPGYEKPLLGALAALGVGLHRMQHECPRFALWLKRLEAAALDY